jgi:hypothetical protein
MQQLFAQPRFAPDNSSDKTRNAPLNQVIRFGQNPNQFDQANIPAIKMDRSSRSQLM